MTIRTPREIDISDLKLGGFNKEVTSGSKKMVRVPSHEVTGNIEDHVRNSIGSVGQADVLGESELIEIDDDCDDVNKFLASIGY